MLTTEETFKVLSKNKEDWNVDLNSLQNDLNNVTIDDFRIYDINNKYLKEV